MARKKQRQKPQPLKVIDRYLRRTGMTRAAMAQQLRVSPGLVSHWIYGRARLTPDDALEIERITDGEVTRRDLLPHFFQ